MRKERRILTTKKWTKNEGIRIGKNIELILKERNEHYPAQSDP